MNFKKTALITGASSGIGQELSKIHAKNGGDLVIIARSKDKLIKLKEELTTSYNTNVLVIAKDLTKADAVTEIYDELSSKNISIDYLINNAGFGGIGKFHERNWEDDKKMIQLNVMALTELTRFFLPEFVNRGSGKILNISSIASLMPGPLQAVYYATKAYVSSFSNAIASELEGTGVTVTTLLPGPTNTNFGKVSDMDKTDFFKDVADTKKVAEDGYQAMMDGKLNKKTGIGSMMKVMLNLIPVAPKKFVLNYVKEGHKFN